MKDINLVFSDFFPFDKYENRLDFSKNKYFADAYKNYHCIYIIATIKYRDSSYIPEQILFIGSAKIKNTLNEIITPHIAINKADTLSDHQKWLKKLRAESNTRIGYAFAIMQDSSHLNDIRYKLIYKNQPLGNEEEKGKDLSSDHCPAFTVFMNYPTDGIIPIIGYPPFEKYFSPNNKSNTSSLIPNN